MLKLKLNQLRIKLDWMAEKIISRLVDRSRYKLNQKVYMKNAIAIKGRPGISFLEFALEGLEKYHSSLGRYNFPDQHPMITKPIKGPVSRIFVQSPISKVKINVGKDIIEFYLNSLQEFCQPGKDPLTYGETAYCDADILQLLNERINLGRYVAEAKLQSGFFDEKIKNEKELEKKLRDPIREKELIKKAREISLRYGFDLGITERYFQWIIKETLKVEIDYLKKSKPEIFGY